MSVDFLFRLLFVLYCLEAGIFLTWAPWTGFWERVLLALPVISGTLMHPILRGGVSGFGLVHLLWVIHDLDGLMPIARTKPKTQVPGASPGSAARPEKIRDVHPLPPTRDH